MALTQLRTGEPVEKGKKSRVSSSLCRAQLFGNNFLFFPPFFFFSTLEVDVLEREKKSDRDEIGNDCSPRSLQHRLKEGKKEREEEKICVDSPPRLWTRRRERDREGAAPATHDAGGVGVSQIQIRSRCSRDTHPPCLRSDTRADLHVRGRVASPRISPPSS